MIPLPPSASYKERIKYNIAFWDWNFEGPVPHFGSTSIYHIGLYADKRIGRKSALQLEQMFFFSRYLKDYIEFCFLAFPPGHESYTAMGTDYKSVGLFVGHELFINKFPLKHNNWDIMFISHLIMKLIFIKEWDQNIIFTKTCLQELD